MTPPSTRTHLAGILQCKPRFREVRTSDSAFIIGAVPPQRYAYHLPLPAALDSQRQRDLLHRARPKRKGTSVRLFRRRTRAANRGEVTDPRSSAARCRQHRQILRRAAARAAERMRNSDRTGSTSLPFGALTGAGRHRWRRKAEVFRKWGARLSTAYILNSCGSRILP
jgi:hypothetical protein